MINHLTSKKHKRFYTKLLSLLVMLSILITSSSAVIAIDTCQAACSLCEQTFTLTPEEGVTVTLSGLMPTNGYAEAKPVEAQGEGVLHAYDITIRYPGGAEFEPADGEPVNVSFESEAIAKAIADKNTSLTVEHITDSGKVEEITLEVVEDDKAAFLAGSFSVYLIKQNENAPVEVPRKTFWFLESRWQEYDAGNNTEDRVSSDDPDAQYTVAVRRCYGDMFLGDIDGDGKSASARSFRKSH